MRAWIIALLVLTAGLAGCLGTEDGADGDGDGDGDDATVDVPEDATWAQKALPHEEDHDHAERGHHQNLSTPNFQQVGFDPLITDYHGETSGDYFCGEVASDDGRDLAVTHGFNNDVAFVLVDVSDPGEPVPVSEMAFPYSHTYDVAMTPDGAYVAVAISGTDGGPDDAQAEDQDAGPDVAPEGAQRQAAIPAGGAAAIASRQPVETNAEHDRSHTPTDGCAGGDPVRETDETPYQSGVVLVDVSDPASPEVADYRPQPAYGPHSIFATVIDGEHHILASTTNLQHQASYFTFFGIEETPLGPQIVERGEHTAQQPALSWQGSQPPLTNGHVDGWIASHPVTDQTLGYLANWDGGLHIVEVTDQGVELVAIWNDYDADAGAGMTGQIHGALPIEGTWDDRHYTFVGQEVTSRPAERPTGQIIMMDTTDPAQPEPAARWTLPVDVEFEESLQFSTHYTALVDQTLFVALYHGGVWAVDASPDAGPELPTLGVFVPSEASPQPPDPSRLYADWSPVVLDVLALPDGELVLFDGTSGVYTVSFDPDLEIPMPEPWTEDAWIQEDGGGEGGEVDPPVSAAP